LIDNPKNNRSYSKNRIGLKEGCLSRIGGQEADGAKVKTLARAQKIPVRSNNAYPHLGG